ncbi:MAG: hypothetical protein V1715_05275 [bacterium]
MKRKLFTKTIFILALMLAANITSANGLLENQRQQLSSMLNEIGQINEHITQIDSDLNGMNNKIAKLENLDKLSWIKRRRIVKLTEEKSTLNSKRMDYYQQLMDLQNTTHQVSSGMLDGISQIIDSLLIEINSATSTTGRISGLEHLLGLNEVRNWTINASSVYAQTGNELIPKKLNIQDYLSMAQSNQLIRNDLLNLMDDKIGELALMIETAKEEEILQNRLEQFALEMTSVGGEIDEKTLNPVKVNKSNAAEVDSWTYNNLSGNETNRDFSNWVLNTQPGILSSLSSYDYLPIIKSLEPSELPNYIFALDSLRNYYVTEKQKLLNP